LAKKDALSQKLNASCSKNSWRASTVVVYVTDPTRPAGQEEEDLRKLLRKLSVPIIAVINKSDLPDAAKMALDEMRSADVGQRTMLEVSATKRQDLNRLVDTMFALLPEGDQYYPDQQLTDVSHTDWLAEIIREKAFLRLEKELPYSIMVEVTSSEARGEEKKRNIEAVVWTTDDRYKKMVIGSKGSMIKQIGMDARKEIEAATGDQVYLKLEVKTDPKWPQRFSTL
jgi:GTP-binding protein Era